MRSISAALAGLMTLGCAVVLLCTTHGAAAHPLGLGSLKTEGQLSTAEGQLQPAQASRRKAHHRSAERRHHRATVASPAYTFFTALYQSPPRQHTRAAAVEPWWEYLWNRFGPGESKAQASNPRPSPKRANKVALPAPQKRPKQAPMTAPKPRPKIEEAISCEAAVGIVGDYGFSDVKPTSCSGKVYAFTATRDGAGYSIQVTSADGEISKVTKQ